MNFNSINTLNALSRSNQLGIITGGVARGTNQERMRIDKSSIIANPRNAPLPRIYVEGPGMVVKRRLSAFQKFTSRAWNRIVTFISVNDDKLILILIGLLLSGVLNFLLQLGGTQIAV